MFTSRLLRRASDDRPAPGKPKPLNPKPDKPKPATSPAQAPAREKSILDTPPPFPTTWVPLRHFEDRVFQDRWEHVEERYDSRDVTLKDIDRMTVWVKSRPLVPKTGWFKRFGSLKVVGTGDSASTTLEKKMMAHSEDIDLDVTQPPDRVLEWYGKKPKQSRLSPLGRRIYARLKQAEGDVTQTPAFKAWFGDSKIVDADGRPLVVYHGTNTDFDVFDRREGFRGNSLLEFKVNSPFKFFTADRNHAWTYADAKAGPGTYKSDPKRVMMRLYLKMERPLDMRTGKGLRAADELYGVLESHEDPKVEKARKAVADAKWDVNRAMQRKPKAYTRYVKLDENGEPFAQAITPKPGYIQQDVSLEEDQAYIDSDIADLKEELAEAEAALEAVIEDSEEGMEHHWERLDAPDAADKLKAAGYDGIILKENDGTISYAVPDANQIKSVKNVGTFDPKNKSVMASLVKVYRGVGPTSKKHGPFYSFDPDFALQFTQSGREHEVMSATIDADDIYSPEPLPYGGDLDEILSHIPDAKEYHCAAIRCSEGDGQPDSIYVFDRSALTPTGPYKLAKVASPLQVDSQQFKDWFSGSKVVNEDGSPMRVFRGDYRGDKVGPTFNKSRSTSGRFYFTEDPEIASSYSTNKPDQQHKEDNAEYADWFRFPKYKYPRERSSPNLKQVWYRLSKEEQEKVAQVVSNAATNDDGDIDVNAGHFIAGDNNLQYELRKQHGNWLAVAAEYWLSSGAIYGREGEFGKILDAAGIDHEFDNPEDPRSTITAVYLRITNPLDTSHIPPNVIERLRQFAKSDLSRSKPPTSDQWAKANQTPKQFVQRLEEDLKEGTTYAWTTMPEKITELIQSMGYDGIKDTGGKSGGTQHTVWIAFEPNQIKSAIGNSGKFDRGKDSILASKTDAEITFTVDDIAAGDSSFEGTHAPGVRIEAHSEYNIVGSIELYFENNDAYVRGITVRDGMRGQGIGQMLYDKAISVAKARGCNNFYSDKANAMSQDAHKAWSHLYKRYPVEFEEGEGGYDSTGRKKINLQSARMRIAADKPITETPAFKAWFAGSQAVDKKGNPLIVYHGSPDLRSVKETGEFKTFKEQYKAEDPGRAFFFAADHNVARTYADPRRAFDYQNAEPGIFAAYLKLTNPMVIHAHGKKWRGTAEFVQEAKDKGHDGLIIYNSLDVYNIADKPRLTDVYVVFSPNQIKAAEGNSGEFSEGKSVFSTKTAAKSFTDRAAFKAWFGDSKVKTADGTPILMYHGGPEPFKKVDMGRSQTGLFWLASDRGSIESGYAGAKSSKHIMRFYVRIVNPAGWDEYRDKTIHELKRDGYDGVILPSGSHRAGVDDPEGFNAIVFRPNQVKIAPAEEDSPEAKKAVAGVLSKKADHPLRDTDPGVTAWIEEARNRADADELYLHGSRSKFDIFQQPNLDYGHLIFFSKLIGDHRDDDKPLQAEYYGPNLYLCKLAKGHPFNPYRDPKAKEIFAKALASEGGVWDMEQKLRWGRFDYQDASLVVPPAIAAGYDRFRIHEVSIGGDSHAVAYPNMITVVEKYEAGSPEAKKAGVSGRSTWPRFTTRLSALDTPVPCKVIENTEDVCQAEFSVSDDLVHTVIFARLATVKGREAWEVKFELQDEVREVKGISYENRHQPLKDKNKQSPEVSRRTFSTVAVIMKDFLSSHPGVLLSMTGSDKKQQKLYPRFLQVKMQQMVPTYWYLSTGGSDLWFVPRSVTKDGLSRLFGKQPKG